MNAPEMLVALNPSYVLPMLGSVNAEVYCTHYLRKDLALLSHTSRETQYYSSDLMVVEISSGKQGSPAGLAVLAVPYSAFGSFTLLSVLSHFLWT